MAGFLEDENNKQPNADPNAGQSGMQAPVFTGTTTREQATPPTGGSSAGPAPAAGPATAAAGGAPGSSAPAAGKPQSASRWTNLVDFLGAQSGDQQAGVANNATQGAQKAAQQATSQTQGVSGGVNSDAAAGVTHGSVTQTSAGGPLAAPTYDLSKVNLSGYSGPSADSVTKRFTGAQQAGVNAAQQASALKSGNTQGSVYDNAVLTQTPNWNQILQTVSGANQAAQNATAGSQGAQEAVANAQRASDANVATQKAQLGDASTAIGKAAGAIQSDVQGYNDGLSSGDATTQVAALNKLNGDQAAMKALGLDSNSVLALRDGIRSGQISPASAKNWLSSYAAAAKGNTGYTQASADQANQITGLLKSSAPAAAATAAGSGLSGTGLATEEAQNASAMRDINRYYVERANYGDDAVKPYGPAAAEAINGLLQRGYTDDDIVRLTGLPPDQVKWLEAWKKTG